MTESTSRRRFLQLFTAGTAACAFADGCTNESSSGPAAFGDVSAGLVSDISVGTLSRVGSQPVFIGRDSAGLYAVTATCTHAGCELNAQGSGTSSFLACPCHGSTFDRNGGVTRGPAQAPLAHFAVEIDSAGKVTIHGGTQVDAAVRVAVM